VKVVLKTDFTTKPNTRGNAAALVHIKGSQTIFLTRWVLILYTKQFARLSVVNDESENFNDDE
jgi:hypothetical protein